MAKRSVSPNISDSSQSCSKNIDDSMNYLNSNSKNEYCGTSIDNLYYHNSPWNYYCSPLIPSRHHTILFEIPINLKDVPKPHSSSNNFVWDSNHVKMPFSPNNVFPVKENNKEFLKPRWEVIQCSLLRPIQNSHELETAIQSYNLNLRRRRFSALHKLFENDFTIDESEAFFNHLLPKIINLAIRLPELIKAPVPLLKQGKPHAISLSQLQISSLLANAFLCTFPSRKDQTTYPNINFNGMYECEIGIESNQEVLEKLKCLIHYFKRVCTKEPFGAVTFERKHLPRSMIPRWDKVENSITNIKLHVTSKGTIEDGGKGMLQVDFANCMIGGGVLHMGCVQEEIRFVICPELIISRLFTEKLAANEAVLIIGAECFSQYTGYASSFEWVKNYVDDTPLDDYGRKRTSIIAIDALPFYFSRSSAQFAPSKIIRELNKAYVGFYENPIDSNLPLAPIATGNWGCGAFGGDVHLKALIQIMAATAANRNIVYFTFGDKNLQYAIFNIYNYLAMQNVTVAQLWRYLCRFCEARISRHQLLPFIKQAHFDSLNNTIVDKPESNIPKANDNLENSSNEEKLSSSTNNSEKPSNKINDDNNINSSPSTSKQYKAVESSEFNIEDDIIETSQDDSDLYVFKTRSKTKKITRKSSETISNQLKKIPDLSSYFHPGDEECKANKNEGFLSALDNFQNKSNDSKTRADLFSSDGSDSLMEVCVIDD